MRNWRLSLNSVPSTGSRAARAEPTHRSSPHHGQRATSAIRDNGSEDHPQELASATRLGQFVPV